MLLKYPNNIYKKLFYLNKAHYLTYFKNGKYIKEMKYLYQFGIVFSFHLPFPTRGFMSFPQNNDDSVISTAFFDIKIKNDIPDGTYRSFDTFSIDSYITRVEFAYFSKYKQDDLTFVFDKCIEHLNNVITSYKIKFKDPTVYRITKEMINTPSILFRMIKDLVKWEYEDYLFNIHNNVPFKKDVISMEEYRNLN